MLLLRITQGYLLKVILGVFITQQYFHTKEILAFTSDFNILIK